VGIERLARRPDLVLPLATGSAEARGDLLEKLVAGLVAEGVVDPAEVVEVDIERGHELAVTIGILQRVRQALLVREPVGQPRQAIVVGQGPHLLQHARVGEGHCRLVSETADLHPVVGVRPGVPPVPQGDDADELPLEAEWHDEQTAGAAFNQREQVGRNRLIVVRIVDQSLGAVE
jgi:hypothetical protein